MNQASEIKSTISSENLTIEKLFSDFYQIPSYQREYVWGKDKEVKEFFDDIFERFEDNSIEYFIGSIIVCLRDNNLYEVIDGQQRIITTYILICAIRSYLENDLQIQDEDASDYLKDILASSFKGAGGKFKKRFRVSVQYKNVMEIIEKIVKADISDEKSAENLLYNPSSKNIWNAYCYLLEELRDRFKEKKTRDSKIDNVQRFLDFLTGKVIVVRVQTSSVSNALTVFATINARGASLQPIDLVKNLMFMNVDDDDLKELKISWDAMTKTLREGKEDPMRFIRYFFVAYHSPKTIKESEVYTWLLDKEQRDLYEQGKAVDFVKSMLEAAKYYINITQKRNKKGEQSPALQDLYWLTNQLLIIRIVLLSAQHLSSDLFEQLCREIENTFFVIFVTGKSRAIYEPLSAEWCIQLRDVKTEAELHSFFENYTKKERRKLKLEFKREFSSMTADSAGRRLKYILARIYQYIESQAHQSNDSLFDILGNTGKRIEIEHILPQNPSDSIIHSFDKPESIQDYIPMLGNLALLEASFNKSAQNKDFHKKEQYYQKSKFIMNRIIHKKEVVGVNTPYNKAIKNLDSFEEWDSFAIEKRQETLTEIAIQAWDI